MLFTFHSFLERRQCYLRMLHNHLSLPLFLHTGVVAVDKMRRSLGFQGGMRRFDINNVSAMLFTSSFLKQAMLPTLALSSIACGLRNRWIGSARPGNNSWGLSRFGPNYVSARSELLYSSVS